MMRVFSLLIAPGIGKINLPVGVDLLVFSILFVYFFFIKVYYTKRKTLNVKKGISPSVSG